ncbi:hypothetical protein [Catenuloplanes japonicus]|uniref:hypothetical protein n=1 Tax=Catenuloplanes japonicus TaxID=33876 RepID=UPI000526ECCF|nr:hypothetical protein [Catenuloplanes japonicus]
MNRWQRWQVRLRGGGRALAVYERHRRDADRLIDRLARTDDPGVRAAVCLDISRELDRAAYAVAGSPVLAGVLGEGRADQLQGLAARYRMREQTVMFGLIRDRSGPVTAGRVPVAEPGRFWPWNQPFDEDEA